MNIIIESQNNEIFSQKSWLFSTYPISSLFHLSCMLIHRLKLFKKLPQIPLNPYFQVSNKIIKPLIPNHPNNLHSIPHFTCVFTLVLDPWLWILFSQVFPVNILFNYASFFAYCKPFLSYLLWYYYWYEFGWWMIFEWRFPLKDLIHTFSEVSRKKKGDK